MNNIDLVILAGGKGTRIKEYLYNYPKPMLKFNNIYFLQYLINNFTKYPFNKIYILTGYRHKIIHKKFHNQIVNFTRIICLKEKKLMGTGGALLNLKKYKVNNFILTNGDTVFNINIKNFIKFYNKNKFGCIALVSKKRNKNSIKLNNLGIKKGKIYYKKKSNLINGGIYFLNKKLLNFIPKKYSSLETDILHKFIKNDSIQGKIYKDFCLDIGTPNYLKISEKRLAKEFTKPAVFLDRDGVINYDYGYVSKIQDFKFRTGVIEGLKYLSKKGYYIFIVTNQAGIAKGKFTEENFFKLQKILKNSLSNKNIFFDDVQYCPFHPKGKIKKFQKKSDLRKPGNKMIKNIFQKFLINKKKSFMIGDKLSDKKCAQKSRLRFFYAENNFDKQVKKILKLF